MPFVIIGVALVVIILLWYISVGNKLNRAVVKIDEAESGIDVALTKRYDVLTKQLDIVKGYAKHESETIAKVIELRRGAPIAEKNAAAAAMSEMQAKINVVAEAYPELRSAENFRALQASVNDTEEHLQAARRAYNANVSSFNQMLVTFPTSIVASSRGLSKRDSFEAEAAKRADVKMEF
ncbi:MAG: LemA family protein [Clostridia bacterium]|nr:LemA family protein [Clostridia bacterium]